MVHDPFAIEITWNWGSIHVHTPFPDKPIHFSMDGGLMDFLCRRLLVWTLACKPSSLKLTLADMSCRSPGIVMITWEHVGKLGTCWKAQRLRVQNYKIYKVVRPVISWLIDATSIHELSTMIGYL